MSVIRGMKVGGSLRAMVVGVSAAAGVCGMSAVAPANSVFPMADAVEAADVRVEGAGMLKQSHAVEGGALGVENGNVEGGEQKLGQKLGTGPRAAWVLGEAMGHGDLPVGPMAYQMGIWGAVYEDLGGGEAVKGGRFGGLGTGLGSGPESQQKQIAAAVENLNKVTGTATEAVGRGGGMGNREPIYSTSVPLPAALPMGVALLGAMGLGRVAWRRRRV